VKREWVIAGMAALLAHALLLFGFRWETAAVPLPAADTAVDVSLVATAPAPAAPPEAAAEPPPEPTPAPPPPEPPPVPATTPPPVSEPAPVAQPTPIPIEHPVHHEPAKPAHPNSVAKAASPPQATRNTGVASAATGGVSSAVRPRSNPKPPYPPEARRLGQQGRVLLEVQVSPDGRATSVSVKRSSGFPILDNAAVQGVERWTFEPARVGGLPTASRADVPVNFALAQ
jgi:protein TonB